MLNYGLGVPSKAETCHLEPFAREDERERERLGKSLRQNNKTSAGEAGKGRSRANMDLSADRFTLVQVSAITYTQCDLP